MRIDFTKICEEFVKVHAAGDVHISLKNDGFNFEKHDNHPKVLNFSFTAEIQC